MNYKQYRSMIKKSTLLFSVTDLMNEAGDIGAGIASLLVAGAVVGGGALGWVGAKVASKDAQDIDHVKKQYDAERLKADLGYLSGQVQTEYADWKRKNKGTSSTGSYDSGRSMRLL